MKFKTGDHVRIIHTPCRYFDRVVTIADIVEGQAHPYRIDSLEPWPLWFGDTEMVLAEHHATNTERPQP